MPVEKSGSGSVEPEDFNALVDAVNAGGGSQTYKTTDPVTIDFDTAQFSGAGNGVPLGFVPGSGKFPVAVLMDVTTAFEINGTPEDMRGTIYDDNGEEFNTNGYTYSLREVGTYTALLDSAMDEASPNKGYVPWAPLNFYAGTINFGDLTAGQVVVRVAYIDVS